MFILRLNIFANDKNIEPLITAAVGTIFLKLKTQMNRTCLAGCYFLRNLEAWEIKGTFVTALVDIVSSADF